MDEYSTFSYREYKNEIPINTVKVWNDVILADQSWQFSGWTGEPKEPLRHWACYPELKGQINNIWECINFSFKEDGFDLKPDRIIGNLFNHGDSSWLHKDADVEGTWTAIVYLNDYWDLNWGGHTILVEDGEIVKCFNPAPGKFILFKSNMVHGATPVSREAPYPRLGLTFQCNDRSNVQRFRESKVPSIPSTL